MFANLAADCSDVVVHFAVQWFVGLPHGESLEVAWGVTNRRQAPWMLSRTAQSGGVLTVRLGLMMQSLAQQFFSVDRTNRASAKCRAVNRAASSRYYTIFIRNCLLRLIW